MTLREMIAAHPDKFYPQTWYLEESFLDREGPPLHCCNPPTSLRVSATGDGARIPVAQLAGAYVNYGSGPIWRRCLWTSDTDDLGQQVYVCDNGKGLEIHRHLHISPRFALPEWN